MFFGNLDLQTILFRIPALLIAITIHEFAHGAVAHQLGDPTPGREGRLSLNPIRHLDFVGSLMVIIFGFGWAKPVQVNTSHFEDPKKGLAMVGAAGPLVNIAAGIILGRVLTFQAGILPVGLVQFVFVVISINVFLGVFNLIPIPPLDGSRVLGGFLPDRSLRKYFALEQYGILIIFGLFMIMGGVLGAIISLPATFIFQLAGLA